MDALGQRRAARQGLATVICVTGNETDLAALERRVAAHPHLHELRIDHLDTVDDGLFTLVRQEGARIVFCCRSRAQGGSFRGTEAERLALLQRASDAGARWIDVEHDVDLAPFDRSRIVLSWHDFQNASKVVEQARTLARRGAAVVKLAVHVDDAAELATLKQARSKIEGRAVIIGMGAAGLLSRVRYRALGSEWTYVAADAERATAPGQIDLEAARRMGLPDHGDAPFLGLVGGPRIFASPGMRTYNQLFRNRSRELSYINIVTESLARSLPTLRDLGARGLSATMPLKLEALELCAPDAIATTIGSVNSLRRSATGWEGTNTDVTGVRAPLAAANARGHALILGAGGAARAARHACGELGLSSSVSARHPRGLSSVVPWDDRVDVAHDVLINATPIAGDASPWPTNAALAPIVFDLAIANRSALLDRARREGHTAIDADRMWLHQGAEQMTWMLGEPVTVAELEAARP